MATPDDGATWETVERAVRLALAEAGLDRVVREVDEARADRGDGDGDGAFRPGDDAAARTFELLRAARELLAGRAALARQSDGLRQRLTADGVRRSRVRFADGGDDDSSRTLVPGEPEADEAAAARLGELIARFG